MRLSLALGCLLLVGCVGPHSSGALWAQQNLDNELAMSRQSDAQRAAQSHAYELTLADESLAAERARIDAALQDCPGLTRQALEVSTGDRVRDAVRLRSADDAQRQTAVAQLALADWRLRRARATAETHFCDEARQALTGFAGGEPGAPDLLAELGSATVTRNPQQGVVVVDADTSDDGSSLSNYALGYVDTLRARAPLPQYLAAVYGGVVVQTDTPPVLNGQPPEVLVDRVAPAYPQWEPDAIYAALQPR